LEQRIYTSQNAYSIKDIIKSSIKGYKSSFYLARQLADRDIKSQYRQSVLGIIWAVLPIFINSLVWIFLQSTGTVKLSETGIPYPLFVVIGSTLWSIIGEGINLTLTSVNANRGIISKINFDKEGLITLGLIKFSFNLLIKFSLIVLFMIYFQAGLSWSALWFFPLLVLTLICLIAIGKIITPLGVLYTDVGRSIPIILQFLMYATPVLYIMPATGIMAQVMRLNPLSYIITDLRNCLTGVDLQYPLFWLGFLCCLIPLVAIAMVVYRVSMPIITEKM
jgi:lipopolysaccharide transport system permease protein